MIGKGLLSGVIIKPGTPLDRLVALYTLKTHNANICATLMNSPWCGEKGYLHYKKQFLKNSGIFETHTVPDDISLERLKRLRRKLTK